MAVTLASGDRLTRIDMARRDVAGDGRKEARVAQTLLFFAGLGFCRKRLCEGGVSVLKSRSLRQPCRNARARHCRPPRSLKVIGRKTLSLYEEAHALVLVFPASEGSIRASSTSCFRRPADAFRATASAACLCAVAALKALR